MLDGIEGLGVAGQVLHQHVVNGEQLIIPNGQDGAAGEEVGSREALASWAHGKTHSWAVVDTRGI